jgi:hypothetical protein
MVITYGVTYLTTFELVHVRWSEPGFHDLVDGVDDGRVDPSVHAGQLPKLEGQCRVPWRSRGAVRLGLFLVRSETSVQDGSYLCAMIPHHSIAILTSERSELQDVRVCELAVEIIEAQRREIAEMDWLIYDIGENGYAATAAEADQRPVPEFGGTATRTCPTG